MVSLCVCKFDQQVCKLYLSIVPYPFHFILDGQKLPFLKDKARLELSRLSEQSSEALSDELSRKGRPDENPEI